MDKEEKKEGVSLGCGCGILIVFLVYGAYEVLIWLSTQTS